ncbi:MAG: hypothetical protein KJZ57_00240 [Anaerolineales bacterium]|nr:hypothetical protein [Anaerolineales bacterium]
MTKKSDMLVRLAEVRDLVPTQDVTAFVSAVLDARRELAKSEVDLERIQATREVALTQIRLKHDLYRQVFERIFDERRDAIQKHFEVLEKGMAADDKELILGALKGLGQIVAASPFSDLKALADALEGGQSIQI